MAVDAEVPRCSAHGARGRRCGTRPADQLRSGYDFAPTAAAHADREETIPFNDRLALYPGTCADEISQADDLGHVARENADDVSPAWGGLHHIALNLLHGCLVSSGARHWARRALGRHQARRPTVSERSGGSSSQAISVAARDGNASRLTLRSSAMSSNKPLNTASKALIDGGSTSTTRTLLSRGADKSETSFAQSTQPTCDRSTGPPSAGSRAVRAVLGSSQSRRVASGSPLRPPAAHRSERPASTRRGPDARQAHVAGCAAPKVVGPAMRRNVVRHLQGAYGVGERRACSATGFRRSSQRYRSRRDPQVELRMRLRDLAAARVRYGYRRLHALLRREGWPVNHKRTHRLYSEEGLSIRAKMPRRKRAWRYRGAARGDSAERGVVDGLRLGRALHLAGLIAECPGQRLH